MKHLTGSKRLRLLGGAPQTVVVAGDSLTEQGGMLDNGSASAIKPTSAWTWANVILGQRFTILKNAGVFGQTAAMLLARLEQDVISLNPGWLWLMIGTNDVGATPRADLQAQVTRILDRCDAAGIRVAWMTIPPRLSGNYSGTQLADTQWFNAWVLDYGRRRRNVVPVDTFSPLASGNNYRATIYGWNPTSDGIHLSSTGGYAAGAALANAIGPLTVAADPWTEAGTTNLLADPRFLNGGSGSAPSGWGTSTSGAPTVTWSKTARTDAPGTWQTAVLSTGSVGLTLQANTNVDGTKLAIGDTTVGLIEFRTRNLDQAATTGFQGLMLALRAYNGAAYTTSIYTMQSFAHPNVDHSGVFRTPKFTVPTGTTVVTLQVEAYGGGTYDLDRAALFNLTRSGIAA